MNKFIFGEAYEDNTTPGHIVYPLRWSKHSKDDVMCLSLGSLDILPYEFAELTRSPDNDYIFRGSK